MSTVGFSKGDTSATCTSFRGGSILANYDKVFVVTSGEYSAYCINRVFSSEEKAKEFIKITRDLYGGTFNIESYELDAPMPTYKEYLFFEAYIEDDIVAKSNFEFYFTDKPNEIKFFRQSDGSYDKICIGTIKLKSDESLDKAKNRAVKVVQDEFYKWMVMNKL